MANAILNFHFDYITFWINFIECHSIQLTTISINVEIGIVKILFKYRYFQDLLIDIDIDIDIFKISLSISISIFSKIAISISISISIFFKSVDISTIDMSYRYIEQGYTVYISSVSSLWGGATSISAASVSQSG